MNRLAATVLAFLVMSAYTIEGRKHRNSKRRTEEDFKVRAETEFSERELLQGTQKYDKRGGPLGYVFEGCRILKVDGIDQQQCASAPEGCLLKSCGLLGIFGCKDEYFDADGNLCGNREDNEWKGCKIVVIDGKSQQQCTNVPKYCSRNKDIFGNEVGNYMKDGGETECGEEGDYWSDWDEEHKVPGYAGCKMLYIDGQISQTCKKVPKDCEQKCPFPFGCQGPYYRYEKMCGDIKSGAFEGCRVMMIDGKKQQQCNTQGIPDGCNRHCSDLTGSCYGSFVDADGNLCGGVF